MACTSAQPAENEWWPTPEEARRGKPLPAAMCCQLAAQALIRDKWPGRGRVRVRALTASHGDSLHG